MKTKLLLGLFILLSTNAYAAITSYDYQFATNDVFSSDFPTRLNSNFDKSLTGGINSVSTSNIVDDTLTEADMADEINPRIRTYEGASCEYVDTGLLPATDSDLTSDISAGTAYPRGYRIRKASATSKTYTASKWTYVDIDINGDFQYTEVSIDASTPSVAANSIRLARVSTDATTIAAVQDLRVTSCTAGPFESISDASGEATLDDLFTYGRTRASADQGFAQGLIVSWDGATTTFSIQPGAARVNGEFRRNTSTTSVPQTADAPATGVSGIDTGAIAANTLYYIYAVADQDSTATMSYSISTNATTPTGITNYRRIGQIKTDASSNFVSSDMLIYHNVGLPELIGGYIHIFNDATSTVPMISGSFNVSSITDNAAGDYTVTWDTDFVDRNYVPVCIMEDPGASNFGFCEVSDTGGVTAGNVRLEEKTHAGGAIDGPMYVMAIGRKKS